MIFFRMEDEHGRIQFVPVGHGMLYKVCRQCGSMFPIDSIVEDMKKLKYEDLGSDILDWCPKCQARKRGMQERTWKSLEIAKEEDRRETESNLHPMGKPKFVMQTEKCDLSHRGIVLFIFIYAIL